MTYPHLFVLAAEHRQDLLREAERERLADEARSGQARAAARPEPRRTSLRYPSWVLRLWAQPADG